MFRTKLCNYVIRFFSTNEARMSVELVKSKEYKVPADIKEHFIKAGQQEILEQLPSKLFRKKHKYPDSYYITSPKAAEIIAQYLTKSTGTSEVVLESNPGPGLLTSILAQSNLELHLFESNETFLKKLEETYEDRKKCVKIHKGDIVNMWKLGYRDRMDNGTRVQDLLMGVPCRAWSRKPMRLFAGVGSLNFLKYLIFSIVRQCDIFSHGRFEMFLAVPPPLYIHLTCTKQIGYMFYRATTILFQILFEYTYLTKIPRKSFLPWQYDRSATKHQKRSQIFAFDSEYLYLVKICPRANIYEMCPLEYMQALLYFVKQNCISRKQRVIPMLEKWAPGCGPRLIVQTEQSETVKPLHRNLNCEIPPFSAPCTTMSAKDFHPSMNIFTEFGDLSPSHILTLFTQFRQWPEFKESTFLASLENSLLKMETSDHESIDTLGMQEEEKYVTLENKTKNEESSEKADVSSK